MKRFPVLLFILFFCESLNAKLPDLIPYREGNLWGYCDSTKMIIIPIIYDEVFLFSGNTAVVEKDKKYGIIDKKGNILVPMEYYDIDVTAHEGKRIAYLKERKCGVIDEHGNIIIPFTAKIIRVELNKYLSVWNGKNLGVYDFDGKVILPMKYGYFCFGVDAGLFIIDQPCGYKFNVVDTAGRFLLPNYYHWIDFKQGAFECTVNDDSTVYYDLQGKLLSHFLVLHETYPYYHQLPMIFVEDSSGRKELEKDTLNPKNNFLVDFYAIPFDSLQLIQVHCKFGLVNNANEVIFYPKYDELQYDENGLFQILKRSPNWSKGAQDFFVGYIDFHGTEYWED